MKRRLSAFLSMFLLFATEAQSAKWNNTEDGAEISIGGYDLAVQCFPERDGYFLRLRFDVPTSLIHDGWRNSTAVELHYAIDQGNEEPKSLGFALYDDFRLVAELPRSTVNIRNVEAYTAAKALMKAKKNILVWVSSVGETHHYNLVEFPAKGAGEAIGHHLNRCKKAFEKAKQAQ